MASLKDSYEGPYHASDLAKWFHSSPHKDLQLDDTTTIFSPSEENYLEALYVLALFISSFGVLLFLLIIMYYTCCYCICRKRTETSENQSSCCSKGCMQFQVLILALICCGALAVGFVFNGKVSDGVDQFRNSCNNIQNDINSAFNTGENMKRNLLLADNAIDSLQEPFREKAHVFVNQVIQDLDDVNNRLPQHVVNESSKAADKVHHYDNYRWLGTVVLLSWCILFCIFLFWIACHVNHCILVMVAISCLLTVLCTWAVVGADFGIATAIGDFCVHPKDAIQKVKPGKSKLVVSYYLDCDGTTYGPFDQDIKNFSVTLQEVIKFIERIPFSKEIIKDLSKVNDDLPFYEANFACSKIHQEYMVAMDGMCDKSLNSLSVVILSLLIIGIFSGLLSCFVCPLWKHDRARPTTYNDIRSPQDDVGNAVLWWPHDVDAESEQSFHQRHGERAPLLIDHRPYANYESGNPANVNIIQVDYHGGEPRVDERQSNNRHSF